MTGEMEPRDLRVSDAEREHVGELLQRAVGQGRLTVEEFTERMDAAMGARTRGELNAVLVDLPGATVQGAPVQGAPVQPVPAGEGLELRCTGSSLNRRGPWVVPPAMRLRTRMSTTVLDFTRAVIEHPTVEIELDDVASSVALIVPVGATVDTDRVQASWSSVTNSVGGGPPAGRPHIVLHGQIRGGSLSVRQAYGQRLRNFFGS